MSKRYKTIFSIQDEPPTWPSDADDDLGLESVSEPDMDFPSSPSSEPDRSPRDEKFNEDDDYFDRDAGKKETLGLGVSVPAVPSKDARQPSESDVVTPGPASRFPIREDD